MSMNNLWLRQSVHGWVLFLGIRYYKQQKPKKWPRQVPRLAVTSYGAGEDVFDLINISH